MSSHPLEVLPILLAGFAVGVVVAAVIAVVHDVYSSPHVDLEYERHQNGSRPNVKTGLPRRLETSGYAQVTHCQE